MSINSAAYRSAPVTNTVGRVALVLAIIGAVLAIAVVAVPVLLFIAAPVLLAAFITAIVGLTRRGLGKTAAVIALILSVVFGIVGPVLFAGRFVTDVGNAVNEGLNAGTDTSQAAAVGEPVVNSDGVEFTVTGVECGVTSITGAYGAEATPQGTYCVVSAHVENGSDSEITVSVNDITGLIGDAEYSADFTGSQIGGSNGMASLNPGLALDATFAIDVPTDATLEYVTLGPMWSLTDDVVIDVRQ